MIFVTCIQFLIFLSFELTEAHIKQFEINVQDFERLALEVNRLGDLAVRQNSIIQSLEARLAQHEAVIKDLSEKIALRKEPTGESENDASKEKISEIVTDESETDVKKSHIIDPMIKLTSKKRQVPGAVAFFAVITQKYEDNVGINQNIIFEDVVTNLGNGYNNHYGIFIAPVSGIYLITTSVLSRQDLEYWAEVMVNNVPIVRMNGRGTDERHGSGSQTLILFLKKGDDVAVQNYGRVDSFWGDKYSSFGGVLLQKYETDPSTVIG